MPDARLELGQHPAPRKKSYDRYLGSTALARTGCRRWKHRLGKTVEAIRALVSYDTSYLGGGNAAKITLDQPSNVRAVANIAGLTGGTKLRIGDFGDFWRYSWLRWPAAAQRRSGADTAGGKRTAAPSVDGS